MLDIERLYSDISKELYIYIYKLSGNKDISEEIVQETFFRAMEQILLGNEVLNKAWFYTVGRNLFFDYVRRQHRQEPSDKIEELIDKSSTPSDSELSKSIDRKDIEVVLNSMKESYKNILILREFKELSYEEIAKFMNISVGQVKITLFRARKNFKKMYERRLKS
ncbi:RNA polymerase sigma factor [Clostridium sp. YIM B02515]|uniref:RNA polymerase sigma factor n=1 Tax=Clostridium rhizosphaerae TaxID=2803861 RepID=A0ABS1TA74_9CLOT|nr:RNA polymerase sigma factor [Clostridium rhizosphaerae]